LAADYTHVNVELIQCLRHQKCRSADLGGRCAGRSSAAPNANPTMTDPSRACLPGIIEDQARRSLEDCVVLRHSKRWMMIAMVCPYLTSAASVKVLTILVVCRRPPLLDRTLAVNHGLVGRCWSRPAWSTCCARPLLPCQAQR
jgi:hypothetical protein